ncbi:family 16 glycoside hydrolase, partial [Mucilaginibacter sp.]
MKNLKTYLMLAVLAAAANDAAAQKGFISLFDGKTLKGWKILAGKAEYKVENGGITGTAVLNSGNTFLVTEKEY